jgi:signal transduction histidine kinase
MADVQAATHDRLARLERLIEIGRTLTSTLELPPLLQALTEAAAEVTASEAASILLIDPKTGDLRFAAVPGWQGDKLQQVTVPIDRSIAGWVVRNREPLVVDDVSGDPRFYTQVDKAIDFQTRSILATPLLFKGNVIGVLEAVNKRGEGRFTPEDTDILTTLSAQAAIAIENARLLEQVQHAYEDLSQLERLKTDFVRVASHELGTPLTLIMGHVAYLREHLEGDALMHLDVVLRNAQRMMRIMEDLSNLAQLSSGEVHPLLETLDLRELIGEVVAEELEKADPEKNVAVVTDLPPTPLTLDVDRDRIFLALRSLVANAIKFTPAGGQVEVRARREGSSVEVAVKDSGIGISREALDHIWDPFYQAEEPMTRRHRGIGLGLSIARRMVEMHGGRIWCESTPGQGSIFTFRLPLHPPVRT